MLSAARASYMRDVPDTRGVHIAANEGSRSGLITADLLWFRIATNQAFANISPVGGVICGIVGGSSQPLTRTQTTGG